MRLFIKHACDPVCIQRAIKISLVIGTIHALLNHFDEIIAMEVSSTNMFQMLFTYLVPYTVATHGSAMQARHRELESLGSVVVATPTPPSPPTTPHTSSPPPPPIPPPSSPSSASRPMPNSFMDRVLLNLRLLWKHSSDPVCMKRAVKVALVVGTVIGIINHFDEVINGTLTTTNYFQIVITFTIPFFVNTYGSARQASHMELQECM